VTQKTGYKRVAQTTDRNGMGDHPKNDPAENTTKIKRPAYPRLWQITKHKSLGGSPVIKQKAKTTIYDTKEMSHKDSPHCSFQR